ncbi:MAG: hypothetical protein B7X94_03820 [Hydrogenophilales bacterium 17-62-8]|nr:MAG: hypothetical protein B7X94_03820 [Hydrogenophilales bacterium 17-62-8]
MQEIACSCGDDAGHSPRHGASVRFSEGAAGGGLKLWSLIADTARRYEVGVTADVTPLDGGDFRLHSAGVALSFLRSEEIGRLHANVRAGEARLGESIEQGIVRLKLKLWVLQYLIWMFGAAIRPGSAIQICLIVLQALSGEFERLGSDFEQ